MSAFQDDHTENMKNPEYAYEYGRSERELEIIKLLEDQGCDCHNVYCDKWATSVLKPLIVLIKEER